MACRITEQLVRKRAEHNNGEMSTLEELSLHQQDLERIEHLDRWCPKLKILYLQNNLIPKIENLSRLKDLRYLNLALNNVTKVENLGGCEFLEKLDLTVNFVDDLLSIESLKDNLNLHELFLTGNPCTDYEGYRDYVVAALPHLLWLDGKEITKSERILAMQKFSGLRQKISEQQKVYMSKKLEKQKDKGHVGLSCESSLADADKEWEEPSCYTPESRVKMHQYIAQQCRDKENTLRSDIKKTPRTLEKDGKMLNVNDGKYEFHLTEDEHNQYILEVGCPRFMDSSLIQCDIQPTYVRITIKDKVLQLVLQEEVSPDRSSAKRSHTTGRLLVTMPKSEQIIQKSKHHQEVKHSSQTLTHPSLPTKVATSHSPKMATTATSPSLKVATTVTSPATKINTQCMQASSKENMVVSEADIDEADVPPLI